MKTIIVVGARPNFMNVAPIIMINKLIELKILSKRLNSKKDFCNYAWSLSDLLIKCFEICIFRNGSKTGIHEKCVKTLTFR